MTTTTFTRNEPIAARPIVSLAAIVLALAAAHALSRLFVDNQRRDWPYPHFSPADVQPGADPAHPDNRHGGEKFPPKVIRACLTDLAAGAVAPPEYVNPATGRVAFFCRLADNRWGVQIVDAVSKREITVFYNTLSRMKNIMARDGYVPVVPLP